MATARTPTWRPRKPREVSIEKYLCDRVARLGGRAYKVAAKHDPAMPDRQVHFIRDWKFYVECKRPGETATVAQLARHDELRMFGSRVYVASTKAEVDEVLRTEVTLAAEHWWLLAVGREHAQEMLVSEAAVRNQWPAAYQELFNG